MFFYGNLDHQLSYFQWHALRDLLKIIITKLQCFQGDGIFLRFKFRHLQRYGVSIHKLPGGNEAAVGIHQAYYHRYRLKAEQVDAGLHPPDQR